MPDQTSRFPFPTLVQHVHVHAVPAGARDWMGKPIDPDDLRPITLLERRLLSRPEVG